MLGRRTAVEPTPWRVQKRIEIERMADKKSPRSPELSNDQRRLTRRPRCPPSRNRRIRLIMVRAGFPRLIIRITCPATCHQGMFLHTFLHTSHRTSLRMCRLTCPRTSQRTTSPRMYQHITLPLVAVAQFQRRQRKSIGTRLAKQAS